MEISRTVFKLLIMVITVIFVGYIGTKVVNNYVIVNKFQKEVEFITDLQHFLKTDQKYFTLNRFDKNLALICFSNSLKEEELEDLGIEVEYNFTKIKDVIYSFKDDIVLKELMKTGQKDLFFIYKDGSWKAYYIKNLLLSTKQLPLCFKPGETIKKTQYYGKINILPSTGRDISEFI
jgi:hypothetical protein